MIKEWTLHVYWGKEKEMVGKYISLAHLAWEIVLYFYHGVWDKLIINLFDKEIEINKEHFGLLDFNIDYEKISPTNHLKYLIEYYDDIERKKDN